MQGSHLMLIHSDLFKRSLSIMMLQSPDCQIHPPKSRLLGKSCQINKFSQAWGEIKECYVYLLSKMPLLLPLNCCCDNPGDTLSLEAGSFQSDRLKKYNSPFALPLPAATYWASLEMCCVRLNVLRYL